MAGSTAQTFYTTKSQASGVTGNVWDDNPTNNTATDTTTTLTYNATGGGVQIATPYTAGAAAAGGSAPTTATALQSKGWRFRQATDVQSVSGALRIIPAGVWAFTLAITSGTYALLANNPSYNFFVVVYRIASGGSSGTALFVVTGTAQTVAASTLAVLAGNSASQPQITLAPGETLQFEYYVQAAATANVLNQVTNNTVLVGTNDTNTRVQLPAPGLRTQYAQSFAASVTCGAALQRGLGVAKAAATLGLAALRRTLAVFKAANPTTTAALQRNITPGNKAASTFPLGSVQRNIAPISKSGVTQEAGALQRSLAVNKAASTSVISAFARAFLHAPFVASTSVNPAFAKVVNIHKNFAATTSTSANLMLGISQAILNRFSGGGTTTIIKKFFSVYDD